LTRNHHKIKAILLLFLCAFNVSAGANDKSPINLTIDDGEFDIIYHRAGTNSSGAILFGLIGAAIQEGTKSSQDEEKQQQILPLITSSSCSAQFDVSLKNKLMKKHVFSEEKSIPNLTVKIDKCGFKVVDSTTMLMSSFVLAKFTYNGLSKETYEETIYITGKKKYSYDELIKNISTSNEEFEKVKKKAGQRIANKIIYKK